MKIITDENIPFVKETFSRIGEVRTVPGRDISFNLIKEADILLVRSVTRVNKELLEGTPVRFVGTATIGTDHIDEDYLKAKEIALASAPGSNANSVSEYVIASLLTLAKRMGFSLKGKSIGIVGVGNVGSKVVKKCEALEMKVLRNDPPLGRKTGDVRYLSLDAILEADIISLHVPLTYEGQDATYHLVDKDFLSKMKNRSILINTSRGDLVEEEALLEAIRGKKLAGVILDVWKNEPNINTELLEIIDLATPHIAGYSLDGKSKRLGLRSGFSAASVLRPVKRTKCKYGQHDDGADGFDRLGHPVMLHRRLHLPGGCDLIEQQPTDECSYDHSRQVDQTRSFAHHLPDCDDGRGIGRRAGHQQGKGGSR